MFSTVLAVSTVLIVSVLGGCHDSSSEVTLVSSPEETVRTSEGPPESGPEASSPVAPTASATTPAEASSARKPLATAPADAWPVFRGTSEGTGRSASTLPPTLTRIWEYRPEKPTSFAATPVIADGLVIAADLDGTIHALRLSDGTVAWSKTYDTNFSAPPGTHDGRLVLGDVYGEVRALDLKTGEEQWTYLTPPEVEISGGPAFAESNVLIGSQDSYLYALDLATGKPDWTFKIDDQIRCTPAVADDVIFLAGCDSKLHFVETDVVASAAEDAREPAGETSPDADAAPRTPEATAAPPSGRSLGSVNIESQTGVTPAVWGDRVFLGNAEGDMFGIDRAKQTVLWKKTDESRRDRIFSSPALTEELVLYGSHSKVLYARNQDTGSLAWSFPSGGAIESSPVVVGDRVYFGTNRGQVFGLEIATGKPIFQDELGGPVKASPAVASGRIVFATDRGRVVCYGAAP